MAEKYKAHVAKWKKEEVEHLKKDIQKYKIIGIADMTGMPSPQLQKMRSIMKGKVHIIMSKKPLIKLALESLKDRISGIGVLLPYLKGMPCLLLTNDNPFAMAKTLKKSKSKAPAKPGQAAPHDIVIPAGPTPFAPGPVIGELGQLGIKATIADGKVTIKEDAHVVKEGELISAPLAAMLTRLNIHPMEIGINLLAVLENGSILTKDVLFVDEAKYLADLKQAALWAFNLAFNSAYPTKETIHLLVKKACLNAEALADSRNILTANNAKKIIAKAHLQTEALKSKLNLQDKEANMAEEEQPKKEEFESDEKAAQSVLKKLQDKKLAQGRT